MTTEIDWQQELDLSFGNGEDVPVGRYVVAGRRAVRRRRLALAAAGVGAAVVVGGIAWGVAADRTAGDSTPIATDSSPSGSSSILARTPDSSAKCIVSSTSREVPDG